MKRYIISFLVLLLVPVFVFGQELGEIDEVVQVNSDEKVQEDEANFVETDRLSREEIDEIMSSNDWGIDNIVDNGVDCFDYYTFQSVQVSIDTQKDYYEPGEVAHFLGKITNKDNQPVVNGNVFVRVSQKNGNYQEEGNFIIDEFIAAKDIVIAANGTLSTSFDWIIPETALTSEYIFDYFFSVGKKFNLGGLPFSNEIIAGNASFNVITKQNSFISFNRSQTEVNGKKYYHIGNWPLFKKGDKIVIKQPLLNTFDEKKKVDVVYELYYWDGSNEKDLLDTKKDQVDISSKGSVSLKYEIPQMNESVYYLKITATSDDQKSIMNIRLTSNQERARLNYPAITKFPLSKGDDVTLFTCFHNTSGINTQGKVVVTLKDENGAEVSRIDYEGIISPTMVADKIQFIAQKSYNHLVLHAQVYDSDGQLVDEYETNYNCEDFNACGKNVQFNKDTTLDNMKYILFSLSTLLFVGVLIFLGIKFYKQK